MQSEQEVPADNPEADPPEQSAPSPAPAAPRRIALISAPRRQLAFPSRPIKLYSPSEFFTLALTLATRTADKTFILSPRYGLLAPDGPALAPYQEAFDRWPPAQRRAWAERVIAALVPRLRPGDICVFYAGRAYREDIQYRLRALGYASEVPLQGLDPDAQLDRLRELVAESAAGTAAE